MREGNEKIIIVRYTIIISVITCNYRYWKKIKRIIIMKYTRIQTIHFCRHESRRTYRIHCITKLDSYTTYPELKAWIESWVTLLRYDKAVSLHDRVQSVLTCCCIQTYNCTHTICTCIGYQIALRYTMETKHLSDVGSKYPCFSRIQNTYK